MNPEQVKALIDLAKASGCRRLKVDNFEVLFDTPEMALQEQDLARLIDPLLTPANEDEVKFWSAGGSGITDTQGNPVTAPLTGEEP